MERVETLCNILAEKIKKSASISDLLSTVKMIESELLHLKNITPPSQNVEINTATVHIAKHIVSVEEAQIQEPINEEKIVEILQIDEEAIVAELEEIKKNAVEKTILATQNRPSVTFDEIDDIPTFANRPKIEQPSIPEISPMHLKHAEKPEDKEVNKTPEAAKELNDLLKDKQQTSVNDILKQDTEEVSHILLETPIKDLKKAIGVNERFLYVNELFRGDEAMYEKSIKTINSFEIYGEAEFWIRRELKLRLGWNENYSTVKQFDQLIRRRFA
jgi:3-methyladenine DNA glycosylase AlkC